MPVLGRCVGDVATFLATAWGQRAWLHHGGGVQDLLTLDDVDHLITASALRTPAFRLVKDGGSLPPEQYTRRARLGSRTITDLVDPARVADLFRDGATVALQGLHRYWPPVAELARELESVLTHPVQANAYLTPPGSQGLRVHADAHDVFAIQTSGRKEWVVHADGPDRPATMQETLVPGDCLYLPKGTHHAARTVAEASLHLTIGVRTVTWSDVVRPAVDEALRVAGLDESLPPGFASAPERIAGETAERLRRAADALEAGSAEQLAAAAAKRFWSARQPALRGQLLQVLLADAIDDATVIRPRAHVWAQLRSDDAAVVIAMADRELRLPAAAEPALKTILGADRLTVGDLAPYLDAESRAVLVRRLVREGLLLVDESATVSDIPDAGSTTASHHRLTPREPSGPDA